MHIVIKRFVGNFNSNTIRHLLIYGANKKRILEISWNPNNWFYVRNKKVWAGVAIEQVLYYPKVFFLFFLFFLVFFLQFIIMISYLIGFFTQNILFGFIFLIILKLIHYYTIITSLYIYIIYCQMAILLIIICFHTGLYNVYWYNFTFIIKPSFITLFIYTTILNFIINKIFFPPETRLNN